MTSISPSKVTSFLIGTDYKMITFLYFIFLQKFLFPPMMLTIINGSSFLDHIFPFQLITIHFKEFTVNISCLCTILKNCLRKFFVLINICWYICHINRLLYMKLPFISIRIFSMIIINTICNIRRLLCFIDQRSAADRM